MSTREELNQNVFERNQEALQEQLDRIGEKSLLLGSKDKDNCEELVSLPFRDRAIITLSAKAGTGKSVLASWLAEFMHFTQNQPIIVFDKKQEWNYHDSPVSRQNCVERIKQLGLEPCGLNINEFAPHFMEFRRGQQLRISLENIFNIEKWFSRYLYNALFNITKDSSESEQRTVAELYDSQSDTINKMLESWEAIYRKSTTTTSRAVKAKIKELEDLDVFEGESFDFCKEIKQRKVIDFLSSTISGDSSQDTFLSFWETYISTMLFYFREKNQLPRCIKLREEVDIAFRGAEKEIIAREIKKERITGHSQIYVLQSAYDIPDVLFDHSALLITRTPSEKFANRIAEKNSSVLDYVFDLKTDSVPCEWLLVTEERCEPFYPFNPCSDFR